MNNSALSSKWDKAFLFSMISEQKDSKNGMSKWSRMSKCKNILIPAPYLFNVLIVNDLTFLLSLSPSRIQSFAPTPTQRTRRWGWIWGMLVFKCHEALCCQDGPRFFLKHRKRGVFSSSEEANSCPAGASVVMLSVYVFLFLCFVQRGSLVWCLNMRML